MSYLKVSINNKTNSFTVQTHDSDSPPKHWNPHSQCQKLQKCWNKKYRFHPNNTSVDDAIKIQSCLTEIQTAYHALPAKNTLWTSFRDFCLIPSTRSKIDAICKEILEQEIVLPSSASDDAAGESSGLNDPASSSATQQLSSTANQWSSAAHGHATSRLHISDRTAHTPQKRNKGKEKVNRDENKDAKSTSITNPSQASSSISAVIQDDKNQQLPIYSLLDLPPEIIQYSFEFLSIDDLIKLRQAHNHQIKNLIDYFIYIKAKALFYVGSENFKETVSHIKNFSKVIDLVLVELSFLHTEVILKRKIEIFPDSLKFKQLNEQEFDVKKFLNNLINKITLNDIAYILTQIISRSRLNLAVDFLSFLTILTKYIKYNHPNELVKDSSNFKTLFSKAMDAVSEGMYGSEEAVELLLLLGIADEDIDVVIPNIEMAKLLVKYNRNLNPKTKSLFFYSKDLSLTKFFLENGVNPNLTDKRGNTILHDALWNSGDFNEELLNLVLDPTIPYPMDINAQDKEGRTVLFHVTHQSEPKFVTSLKKMRFLLEKGADPNRIDRHGFTPLYLANGKHYKEKIHLLLKFGANINIQNDKGKTPIYHKIETLHLLSYYKKSNSLLKKYIKQIKFFVENGADLSILPHVAEGPISLIHLAISFKSLKLLKLFVENGVILYKNRNGETPLERAKSLGLKEIAKYLQKIEAKQSEEMVAN